MKTLNQSSPELELKHATDAFETSLARPLISGELASWVHEVQMAWKEAAAHIHYHTKHLHPRQYQEIAKHNPELLPRIDVLRAEDAALEERREALNHLLTSVTTHAAELGPDEEKAHKYLQAVIDDGMKFVILVRKQSVAVQTWYMEAFNRDVGAVD